MIMHMPVHMPVHIAAHMSVHMCLCSCAYAHVSALMSALCACLYACLYTCLSTCLHIMSVHMYVHMSVHISVHMSVYMSVLMYVHMSVHVPVHMPAHVHVCVCTHSCAYVCGHVCTNGMAATDSCMCTHMPNAHMPDNPRPCTFHLHTHVDALLCVYGYLFVDHNHFWRRHRWRRMHDHHLDGCRRCWYRVNHNHLGRRHCWCRVNHMTEGHDLDGCGRRLCRVCDHLRHDRSVNSSLHNSRTLVEIRLHIIHVIVTHVWKRLLYHATHMTWQYYTYGVTFWAPWLPMPRGTASAFSHRLCARVRTCMCIGLHVCT